ncbi:hypothetical protein XA68_14041 [Ophiocordyceps unilateralis]|uniref:Uncharacterized protein n=1 Tax=Ophiocordyceps unilateralis TaxID=268505 RepID=A0A2A9PAE8_OPHUN|nr:hypothetical protein XA68_14041 [Ophiocordyceps unilateralis]
MTSPSSPSNSATAGEKHQTDHPSPDAKRRKPQAAEQHEKDEEPRVPSNVLEKGVFYLFVRGRVDTEELEKVDDIARSYILLRPVDTHSKLGDGPLDNSGTTRLLALPKKVLPVSGRDRFMAFVEKSGPSYDELKTSFLDDGEYETRTVGKRHTPAATPVGEGVYVITTTGRESHLAYMRTLPEDASSVQSELGFKDRGSFILSTKNPSKEGPARARLPEGPEYPQKILDEFRGLRWLPTRPEHLNYVNAQLLLIGESSGLDKAVEAQTTDEENDKAEPIEVLNHLEEEDLERMRQLPGTESDAIFADLRARAKDYPKLQTSF